MVVHLLGNRYGYYDRAFYMEETTSIEMIQEERKIKIEGRISITDAPPVHIEVINIMIENDEDYYYILNCLVKKVTFYGIFEKIEVGHDSINICFRCEV